MTDDHPVIQVLDFLIPHAWMADYVLNRTVVLVHIQLVLALAACAGLPWVSLGVWIGRAYDNRIADARRDRVRPGAHCGRVSEEAPRAGADG